MRPCGVASCDNGLSQVGDAVRVDQIFEDGAAIDEALQCAAAAAHLQYARAGLSVPIWSDGGIQWIEPLASAPDDGQREGHSGSALG